MQELQKVKEWAHLKNAINNMQIIFLPNFSRSFFTCQRSIFSGVGTKLIPLLKRLNSASVMFRLDKLNTLLETNLPFILLLSSSISHVLVVLGVLPCQHRSCSLTFKAGDISSLIKLASISARSITSCSFSVPS